MFATRKIKTCLLPLKLAFSVAYGVEKIPVQMVLIKGKPQVPHFIPISSGSLHVEILHVLFHLFRLKC